VTCEVEVNAWSGVRVGEVSVATSVVKSMVEGRERIVADTVDEARDET
jgi:hypothetical protein